MTQTSHEALRGLEYQLINIVGQLVVAIDAKTDAGNNFAVAKANVEKLEQQKRLLEIQIMNEKKLIDATRN